MDKSQSAALNDADKVAVDDLQDCCDGIEYNRTIHLNLQNEYHRIL